MIPTGTGTSPILIDFGQPIFELTGSMTVLVGGFAQFSGNFALQQLDLQTVPLTGGGTVSNATALTIGVSAGTAFVGVNAGTAQAYGLSVSLSSLGIAFIKPTASTDTRSWLALSASVNDVTATGIPGLTSVTGSGLTVSVNAAASDGTAVDFASMNSNAGLSIPTTARCP